MRLALVFQIFACIIVILGATFLVEAKTARTLAPVPPGIKACHKYKTVSRVYQRTKTIGATLTRKNVNKQTKTGRWVCCEHWLRLETRSLQARLERPGSWLNSSTNCANG